MKIKGESNMEYTEEELRKHADMDRALKKRAEFVFDAIREVTGGHRDIVSIESMNSDTVHMVGEDHINGAQSRMNFPFELLANEDALAPYIEKLVKEKKEKERITKFHLSHSKEGRMEQYLELKREFEE